MPVSYVFLFVPFLLAALNFMAAYMLRRSLDEHTFRKNNVPRTLGWLLLLWFFTALCWYISSIPYFFEMIYWPGEEPWRQVDRSAWAEALYSGELANHWWLVAMFGIDLVIVFLKQRQASRFSEQT